MKKLSFLVPILLFISAFLSCNNQGKVNQESYDLLQSQKDSCENELNTISGYMEEISRCIDSVSIQEGLLLNIVNPETGAQYSKMEMTERVRQFGDIINRQKLKIRELSQKLTQDESNIAQLKQLTSMVDFLNKQLEERQQQIEKLKMELKDVKAENLNLLSNITILKEDISDLNELNKMQEEALSVQDEMLNEGLVILGTKKELSKEGILTSGGIFKKKKLNISNLNPDKCMKVDIREFKELEINGKNPKILSAMPVNSYTLKKIDKNNYILQINNPTEFWGVSNYLIIQYD